MIHTLLNEILTNTYMSRNRFFVINITNISSIYLFSQVLRHTFTTHILSKFYDIFNMSIHLQFVLDVFLHHLNDIDVLNIKYSFNFFVIINSLLKSRTFNKFIATINISFDRIKTLIVIIIARNNSIKNDIALYSKIMKCLDNLTKRLKIDI